jgi:hypothetical protein
VPAVPAALDVRQPKRIASQNPPRTPKKITK